MAQQAAKKKIYRNYTQEELDAQYNNRERFSAAQYTEENQRESARVRGVIQGNLDVSYGPTRDEVLDIFAAEASGAPVAVFIHGGAWQRGDKGASSYPAESFVPAGVTYIATNFSLIPPSTLDETVRQNRAALAWVYRNAERFGGDPDRIFVLGHSSGGHITAMVACTDWVDSYALPADLIKGAVCLSGMYDLEPVKLCYRNGYLKLDEEGWRRNSPILNIPENAPPLIVGCGEFDADEFRRQPRTFLEAWVAAGHHGEFIEHEGLNHFETAREYNNPDGAMFKSILAMMGV
jgi:arylformamidase